MKYAIVGIITFLSGSRPWGAVYLNGLGQDEIYDQAEVANERFKMRLRAQRRKDLSSTYLFCVSISTG